MALDKIKYNPSTWDDILEKYSRGDPVCGTVSEIVDYGAWIELGVGITGLLHITDISWRRVRSVADELAVGDRITCMILKVNLKHSRISLGTKQLTRDPFESMDIQKLVGTTMNGTVTALMDYGIYCEISPGVEGLIHIGELSLANTYIDPHTVASVGDRLEVVLTLYDRGSRRISLALAESLDKKWHS